jgi:hypothetical protein
VTSERIVLTRSHTWLETGPGCTDARITRLGFLIDAKSYKQASVATLGLQSLEVQFNKSEFMIYKVKSPVKYPHTFHSPTQCCIQNSQLVLMYRASPQKGTIFPLCRKNASIQGLLQHVEGVSSSNAPNRYKVDLSKIC